MVWHHLSSMLLFQLGGYEMNSPVASETLPMTPKRLPVFAGLEVPRKRHEMLGKMDQMSQMTHLGMSENVGLIPPMK